MALRHHRRPGALSQAKDPHEKIGEVLPRLPQRCSCVGGAGLSLALPPGEGIRELQNLLLKFELWNHP